MSWDWDEIGRTRRRAKSYRNALQNDLKSAKSRTEKNAIRSNIRALDKYVKQSYRGSGYDPQKAANMIESQLPQGKNKRMGRIQRRNFVFRQQFRQAQFRNDTGLGRNGAAKVKIFYKATQAIWDRPGISPQERDRVVMRALGTSDFAEAVDIVLRKNQKALKAVSGLNASVEITDENAGWYQGIGNDVDEIGSPDYLNYVVSVVR